MKTKEIIKQFKTDNPKMMTSIVFLIIGNVIFTIGIPILLLFSVNAISDIKSKTETISILKGLGGNGSKITQLNGEIASNMTVAIILSVILAVVIIWNSILAISKNKNINKYGKSLTSHLRKEAYDSVLNGELKEFEDRKIDDVIDVIDNDTELLAFDYRAGKVLSTIDNGVIILSLLITTFVIDALVGLIFLGIIPIFYLIETYVININRKKSHTSNKAQEEHNRTLREVVYNLKTIKIRNGISKEKTRYEEVCKDEEVKFIKHETSKNLAKRNVGTLLFGILLFSITALALGTAKTRPDFKMGNIVSLFMISLMFSYYFNKLVNVYTKKLVVSPAYNRLDEVLNFRSETRSEPISSLDDVQTLKFNNVSYEYDFDRSIGIKNIAFDIKKGEKLGILGYQKSGKTTIADLIAKIIKPRHGNVLINNCDINKLNTYYLRDIITYVPQSYNLIRGSIESNIIYPSVLDEYKYNDALNKCRLKELLMTIPDGDQEQVANLDLSDEEKQRIGLAYALYKDSSIVILDEATSKLKLTEENRILNEFYKLKNKMIIVISNRLSALVKCDKILIINEGKVVEYGSTKELLENKRSTYSKMMRETSKKIV